MKLVMKIKLAENLRNGKYVQVWAPRKRIARREKNDDVYHYFRRIVLELDSGGGADILTAKSTCGCRPELVRIIKFIIIFNLKNFSIL